MAGWGLTSTILISAGVSPFASGSVTSALPESIEVETDIESDMDSMTTHGNSSNNATPVRSLFDVKYWPRMVSFKVPDNRFSVKFRRKSKLSQGLSIGFGYFPQGDLANISETSLCYDSILINRINYIA